ncbi:TetR family transcriptional regulator [Ktedonobacter racemifer]|uniref:Transcriptional regulator, TetR family n=1 Tax=Ktedonobacter racemifer DSM 44963 TaxID=485913 RepID=D6TPE9_KTERA|nr:TetR family transcriptional regulator [Ktedonobacter racemifer]EFH85563.1 transcriptional regulator, TetR family [Ktedonobacter racemifer DSM 44963]
MSDEILTRERILNVAEEVLRRYGPAKTTVIDVARALNVSHGSVYRHFPSKAALRDAVTERWLVEVSAPLQAVVTEDTPAPERLRRWLKLLISTKHRRAFDDPELFATYMELVKEARTVVKAHVELLAEQATYIISDGVRRGEFETDDPISAGQAVIDATTRLHNPTHASEWSDPDIDAAFERIWHLILCGLGKRNNQA